MKHDGGKFGKGLREDIVHKRAVPGPGECQPKTGWSTLCQDGRESRSSTGGKFGKSAR
jgi:hypothetical protein